MKTKNLLWFKSTKALVLLITVVYFLVILFGTLNHEPWRDEHQAWLITVNSHNAEDLYQNTAYEGSPILWHTLLFLLSFISTNIIMMKLASIMIATASVYLFVRYSDFPLYVKILFAFSYYSIYEYAVIARSYGLSVFLTFLFCVLYKNRDKNILWLGIVLFLLANTTAFGLAISLALSIFLLLDLIFSKISQQSIPKVGLIAISATIFMLGASISAWQIMPEKDHERQINFALLKNPVEVEYRISRMYSAYTTLPELRTLPEWDTVGLTSTRDAHDIDTNTLAAMFILLSVTLMLLGNYPALTFFWTGTLGIFFVVFLSTLTAERYVGHFFLVFIASVWLARVTLNNKWTDRKLRLRALPWNKIKNGFLVFLLGSQVVVGLAFYKTDLDTPFSASTQAAEYIKQTSLEDLPVIGMGDAPTSNFAYLLKKPIYYPERSEYGTFIIWDGNRHPGTSGLTEALNKIMTDEDKALLIVNSNLSPEAPENSIVYKESISEREFNIKFLKKFEDSMVRDEKFYLYLIEEAN